MQQQLSGFVTCTICNPFGGAQSQTKMQTQTQHGPLYRLETCGHIFHQDCIDSWMNAGKRTCPNCRSCISAVDLPTQDDPPHDSQNAQSSGFVGMERQNAFVIFPTQTETLDINEYYPNVPVDYSDSDVGTFTLGSDEAVDFYDSLPLLSSASHALLISSTSSAWTERLPEITMMPPGANPPYYFSRRFIVIVVGINYYPSEGYIYLSYMPIGSSLTSNSYPTNHIWDR